MKGSMFKLVISVFALLLALQVNAQDKPAPSPLGKVYQRVGVTDIEVTYSRPGVKGRTVFAQDALLAPFDNLWRTGANAATVISFSTDVTVGGKKVPAGKYAILSIPGKDSWTFILNSDAGLRGTGGYAESKDVARLTVTPTAFPMPVETLTFGFANVKDTSTDLFLVWGNTMVAVPIEVAKTW